MSKYLIALTLLLAGCGVVNNDGISYAQATCSKHGGLGFMLGTMSYKTLDFVCKDGAKFEIDDYMGAK